MNGTDPQAYLHDVLTGIAYHPMSHIDELLPFAYVKHQTADLGCGLRTPLML